MSEVEQDAIERARRFTAHPKDMWEVIFSYLEENPTEASEPIGKWLWGNAIHLRDSLYPEIEKSKENALAFHPTWVMWGYESQQRTEFNNRTYNYEFGTHGTGYILLTDKHCYIYVSAKTTELKPLYKKQGGFTKLLMATALGMLGERNKIEPTLENRHWKIPIQSIKTIKDVTSAHRQECIEVVTDIADLLIYPIEDTLKVTLQMYISGRIVPVSEKKGEILDTNKLSDNALTALKQLKSMLDLGLISEEDYDTKKADILGRL
ncbi:MAG: SHOCT domain-containing protein [Anaerolineales bacterium]|nr:SHOCT domain-containing protein [Anaerolineales bacterium]